MNPLTEKAVESRDYFETTNPATQEVLAEVASGAAQVVVGTHALMQEGVAFHGRAGNALIKSLQRLHVDAWRCTARTPSSSRRRIRPSP